MQYDLPLWRPPSEARSLILQVTYGCSHNRCTFCHMYVGKRFRVRPEADVLRDVEASAELYPTTRRVFLADGDPLAVGAPYLVRLAERLWKRFPRLERIATYATPQNVLRKSPEALRAIRQAGISLLYFGVESGDAEVLRAVDKGVDPEGLVTAAHRAHEAGFQLSCTVLLGLAGRAGSLRHARATGEVLSRIDPAYASALSIMVPAPEDCPDTPLRQVPEDTPWVEMTPFELVEELRELIASLHPTDLVFRSNHASNYLPVGGRLPRDREALLALIDAVLAERRSDVLRPDFLRGL